MPRLTVRSVVGRNDRSYDAMIDRAIDRCTPRLIYDRPSGATTDRTPSHRMPRVFVRSVAGCNDWSYHRSPAVTIDRRAYDRSPRLIVPSVVGRNNWSYIGRWSLPLLAQFPTTAVAIDIFLSFVIARPRVEINHHMRPLLEIVANIADRSHLGPIVRFRNRTIRCDCGFSR